MKSTTHGRPNDASPIASSVIFVMLSFIGLLCAATVWTVNSESLASVEDRYADPVFQHKLAEGLAWLKSGLIERDETSPTTTTTTATATTTAPACGATRDADALHRCRVTAINERLSRGKARISLARETPPPTLRPAVALTLRWLAQFKDGAKLATILQAGDAAAVQFLDDPFRLAGCVRIGTPLASVENISDFCKEGHDASNASAWPPQTEAIRARVLAYSKPEREHSPNIFTVSQSGDLKTQLHQGRHVVLAQDARTQQLAQSTAACYTGDAAACAACYWCNQTGANVMHEGARARAMGIMVIDVASGRIEAAGSGYTRCYAAQHEGQTLPPECPAMPGPRVPRRYLLGNQALAPALMPGSLVKVLIASALASTPLHATERSALPDILTRSDTADLIDIVLCKEDSFDPDCARRRLVAIDALARSVGWGATHDLLTGGLSEDLRLPQPESTFLQLRDDADNLIDMSDLRLSTAAMQACSNQPKENRWRNCQGRDLVNVVSELFGQGNAQVTALGIARLLSHLASAEQGSSSVALPHWLSALQEDNGSMMPIEPRDNVALPAYAAREVVSGLARTHTSSFGTARSACIAAASGMRGALTCDADAPAPAPGSLRIFGKTGTPVFSADIGENLSLSLPQWRDRCATFRAELTRIEALETSKLRHSARWYHLRNEAGKCNMRPLKWYAFAVADPTAKTRAWDKVVVVYAERNWNRVTQRVDSPNDRGINVAAEAGLAFANGLYSAYPKPTTPTTPIETTKTP